MQVQWPHWSNGYGEFIRGYIFADQTFGQAYDVIPVIDPKISISKIFEWANSDLYTEDRNTPQLQYLRDTVPLPVLFDDIQNHKGDIKIIISYDPVWENLEKYQYLLTPILEYKLQAIQKAKQIIDNKYRVLHIRTGIEVDVTADSRLNVTRESFIIKAKEILASYSDMPMVVMCDDISLIPSLGNVLSSNTNPKHSRSTDMTTDDLVDFCTDLYLIQNASEVLCLCNFPWYSSGFSFIPSVINNIPYRQVIIDTVN